MAMKTTTVLFLLLISSLLFLHAADAVVNCNDVAAKAAACIGFVTGKVTGKPPGSCCSGLQQLARGAGSVDDRRAICRCMKNGVKAIPGVQDKFLGQVPGACGIKVGFPVSLNTNCDKIN